MRARLRVDQLRVDPHPVLVALHGAFEDVTHAKFLADLLGVDRLALEGKGRVARDDETVADAREIGRQVLGYAVGEIVLGRVAGEIGEGQHDEGKMRGLGRRRRGRGDRRWRYDGAVRVPARNTKRRPQLRRARRSPQSAARAPSAVSARAASRAP